MNTNTELNTTESAQHQRREFTADFPVILEDVAKTLREAGCGPVEIRLALLAMCGVPVHPVSQVSLRTFG